MHTAITSQKSDITVILGLFNKESKKFSPKLLLLRFQKKESSLSNEESAKMLAIIVNVAQERLPLEVNSHQMLPLEL